MGFRPALTFHPGTQCADPAAWGTYIAAAARVVREAGVPIGRLNVGGGFASHRDGAAPDLEAIFDHIEQVTQQEFGPHAPALLCEPGRAMAAEAFTLATRVKALRGADAVLLNDGVYGGLFEARDIGTARRISAIAPDGTVRNGPPLARTVFGPTCDSLDRLPDEIDLPSDLAEGDYLLFAGMGAYSLSLATRFNGYGLGETVTVDGFG